MVCEILNHHFIESFSKLKFKEKSVKDYDGYNGYKNSSPNMLSVSSNGEKSICCINNLIYLEKWWKSHYCPKRVSELNHQMNHKITLINADFERDFVVTGDTKGFVMIQRISINEILFPKTQILQCISGSLISSSILNDYLCIGNVNCDIGIIDLNTFTKKHKIKFLYENNRIWSLKFFRIKSHACLIATGIFI